MFCEACSSRMDPGALMCPTCGNEARQEAAAPRRVQATFGAPEAELTLEGPACTAHPGLPLVGTCPRCKKAVCIRCAPEAARDLFTCTDCQGLTTAHQPSPEGSTCALHPEVRAAFICSRCGSFACVGCAAPQAEGRCVRCVVSTGVPASRGSRFAANLVDNFVLVAVFFVVVLVTGFLAAGLGLEDAEEEIGAAMLLAMLVGVVVGCGVQIVAQLQWRQSIGKRLLGIKVVRTSGDDIELWRLILVRNVAIHVVAQFCGVIGLVDSVMIFKEDRRCLHDHLADTIVIEAPPEGSARSS